MECLVRNCPRLETIGLQSFDHPLKNVAVHALGQFLSLPTLDQLTVSFPVAASLSELCKLTLESRKEGGDETPRMMEMILSTFGEHPFGADIVCPWPRLTSAAYSNANPRNHYVFSLFLRGKDSWITSLSMKTRFCIYGDASHLKYAMKALNRNGCPKLKKLSIQSCRILDNLSDSTETEDERLRILYELLAYVRKRQAAVQSGTPFLHSLSLIVNWFKCSLQGSAYWYNGSCNKRFIKTDESTERRYFNFSVS